MEDDIIHYPIELFVDALDFYGPVPSNELELSTGNLLTTVRSIFQEYYIGFEFYITRHTAEQRSLVQLTVGGNSGQDGDRIPGIWLNNEDQIWVISSVNGDVDYGYVHYLPIKIGIWYKVEIEQVLVEKKVCNEQT